jgi:hypothetical protein
MPVVLDAPPEAAPPTVAAPEPANPYRRRQFPWTAPQTRNAASADDGELILDNGTPLIWTLSLGYHDLGFILPFARRTVRVVKSGRLAARPSAVPGGAEYLTAYLNPQVTTVQIRREVVMGMPAYDLLLIEGAPERDSGSEG